MQRGNKRISRLFNPYTGADLGDPLSPMESVVDWLVDFHANLLSGTTGRLWKWNWFDCCNADFANRTRVVVAGSEELAAQHRHQLESKVSTIQLDRAQCDRVLVLAYCCADVGALAVSTSDFPSVVFGALGDSQFMTWLVRLHFGRFGRLRKVSWFYWPLSTLWVVLGLIPVVIAITGFLMWWNRVLRKKMVLQPE